MNRTIQIAYPEFLANSLRLNEKDFENEIKISSLVKLFEVGKITSGTAAKKLGITRIDFLDLLAKYKVSALGVSDSNDLKEEIANA